MRLQKFLASCGIGSRRACEKLIARGVVSVDGVTVVEPGTTVDPNVQKVAVRGRLVAPDPPYYVLLNKPAGYLCTGRDPAGRSTFRELLPPHWPRLFSVGRLDRDSEGLLLLTNDGEWAHGLTHPRHLVRKRYLVWIDRKLSQEQLSRFSAGITSRGELLRASQIRMIRPLKQGAQYEIELAEGRNRHIRRMVEAVGARVIRLRRVAIGPLKLGTLNMGSHRLLTPKEIDALRRAASGPCIDGPT